MDIPLSGIMQKIKEQVSRLSRETPMDKKELADRQEATTAYAGEDPKHFVDYGIDCVRTSVIAMKKIRERQRELLKVYYEEAPPNYARKEKWQSRVILPKPNSTVAQAMATVRRAFSIEFLSVENNNDKRAGEIWEKVMRHYLNRSHSNFPVHFTDATGMALAIGQSMELLPVWRPGQGLKWISVEPWKIARDPDAFSREPQSGLYWIHQEYLDYHVLKQGEADGRYMNVDKVKNFIDSISAQNPDLNQAEMARRKEMLYWRSDYRKAILTSEFWGTILAKDGTVLLPKAKYTWAGDQLIEAPKAPPYSRLRWPGTAFSPLPHFLRFDGRGILHGVQYLWYFMCSLAALHNDYLNWVVNPMLEVTTPNLVDQSDLAIFPGKPWLVRETMSGNQNVRTIDRRSITNDIMSYEQFCDQFFDTGSMVTANMRGLPGWRQEVTKGEAEQNLGQNQQVFTLIGSNIEDGALSSIEAAQDVIAANAGPDDLREIFSPEEIQSFVNEESPTGLELPKLTGSFHVSGMTAVMKDMEVMRAIQEVIIPLVNTPQSPFAQYFNFYNLCKSIEMRLNLRDEHILVEPKEGQAGQVEQNAAEAGAPTPEQMATEKHQADLSNIQAQNEQLKARGVEHIAKAQAAQAQAEMNRSAGEQETGTPNPARTESGL